MKEIQIRDFRDTITQLDDHLQRGGSAVIRTSIWDLDGSLNGHYSLCIKKEDEFYTCVNHYPFKDKTPVTQVFELSLRDDFLSCREDPADIWFLKKRGH